MAFRGGRGRGRGRGGMGGGFAKQEEFILFPEGVKLPDVNRVSIEEKLIIANSRLQHFWMASPYYLDEATKTKKENTDIERYCDRNKPKTGALRDHLFTHLNLSHTNFPAELIEGTERIQLSRRKVQFNPHAGADLHRIDFLVRREEKYGDKDEISKKEGENEEEDEEGVEVEDEEFSSDGDYNQNQDFDDDEDEYNMEPDGDDEPTYG